MFLQNDVIEHLLACDFGFDGVVMCAFWSIMGAFCCGLFILATSMDVALNKSKFYFMLFSRLGWFSLLFGLFFSLFFHKMKGLNFF